MKDSHYYLVGAKAAYTTLIGFIGGLGAYVASQTHEPLTATTSAILLYATAECANNTAGRKPLCLQAASGIKKGFSKIRQRL
jgi:hypothetical protein